MTRPAAVPSEGWLLAALAGGGILGALGGALPLLTFAGVAAIGYVALTAANIRLGLCLFTVITFLDVLPVPLGPAASFSKLAGVVLALAWLATIAHGNSAGRRGLLDEQPGTVALLVAFLAWAAVTSVWAPSPDAAFASVSRYALNVVLFLIASSVLRTRRDISWVIAAFVAGTAISVAYGIALSPAAGSTAADRASGTVGDPNEFAAVLVAGLPLAVALASGRSWSPRLRALGVVAAGLSVVGIVLSLSRGGLVALVVVLIAGVVLAGRWRAKLLLLAPLALVATVGYFLVTPAALQRITSSNGGTGRTDLWAIGWRMVEDRPVLGVGTGNYQQASIHYLLRPGLLTRSDLIANVNRVAHNTYLTVLAELGLVGAVMFLALIAIVLACGVKAAHLFARKRDDSMEMLTRGWLIAMVGMLTADVFLSAEFSKQLWLLLALGPALLSVARRSPVTTARAPDRPSVERTRAWVRASLRDVQRGNPSPVNVP